MTLQFEQTIDDVVALREFAAGQGKFNIKIRSRVFLVMVIAAAISIGIIIILNPSKAEPENLILAVAMIVFMSIFYSPKGYRYRIKSSFSKSDIEKHTRERTFVLGEYGIDVKAGSDKSFVDWEQIELKETKSYFFLFNSKKSALIIPKRIFLLPQDEQDVKSFIERKLG